MSGPSEIVKSPPRTKPCTPGCLAVECLACTPNPLHLLQGELRERTAEIAKLRAQVQGLERQRDRLLEDLRVASPRWVRELLAKRHAEDAVGVLREMLKARCVTREASSVRAGFVTALDLRGLEVVEAWDAEDWR